MGRKQMVDIIMEEHERLERDIQKMRDSFIELDKEFQKWKEGVLKFEHSEYCSDDNSELDPGIHDRERIWSDEDENDIQRSIEQDNRGAEDGDKKDDLEGGREN